MTTVTTTAGRQAIRVKLSRDVRCRKCNRLFGERRGDNLEIVCHRCGEPNRIDLTAACPEDGVTLRLYRNGAHWLGECVELGTATFADTLAQVSAELGELVELHLETKRTLANGKTV